jgi:hypothetical protein
VDDSVGPALELGETWFPLHQAVVLVGRRSLDGSIVPDVDLGTLDVERRTSRRHAELTSEHGIVHVRDLGSTNGTLLNGEPVPTSVAVLLREGDRLSFAGVAARFAQARPWPGRLAAEPAPAESQPAPAVEDSNPTAIGPRPRPAPPPPAPPPAPWWRRLLARLARRRPGLS